MRQYPYQEISRQLEKYIEDNKITGRMPGILKLSRELDVNHVTLSRAIHELEKKGIVAVNGTKGTFVIAKERVRPRRHTIGVIGLDEHSPWGSWLLSRFKETAEAYGYHMIGLLHQPELFEKDVEILGLFPVDGFMFTYSSLTVSIAEYLRRENIPYVTCNFHPGISGVDMCDYDSDAAYTQTLKMLMEQGHRRIAFLGFGKNQEYNWLFEKILDIWRKNLKEDFDEKLILTDCSIYEYIRKYPSDFYYQMAAKSMDHLLNLKNPPTAVIGGFSVIDECRKYLEKRGIPVLEKISLIGFQSGRSEPVSTIDYWDGNVANLCKWALTRLLERLNGKDLEPEKKVFPLTYHKMGSTGAVPLNKEIIYL